MLATASTRPGAETTLDPKRKRGESTEPSATIAGYVLEVSVVDVDGAAPKRMGRRYRLRARGTASSLPVSHTFGRTALSIHLDKGKYVGPSEAHFNVMSPDFGASTDLVLESTGTMGTALHVPGSDVSRYQPCSRVPFATGSTFMLGLPAVAAAKVAERSATSVTARVTRLVRNKAPKTLKPSFVRLDFMACGSAADIEQVRAAVLR